MGGRSWEVLDVLCSCGMCPSAIAPVQPSHPADVLPDVQSSLGPAGAVGDREVST